MSNIIKKVVVYIMVVAVTATNIAVLKTEEVTAANTNVIKYKDFLKANGKVLKNNYGQGDTVYLRGTNAGGYMLQEFWMTPTSYTTNVSDQMDIINTLTNRFGSSAARTLIDTYERNYWTEADFNTCASLGINCIRLPLWYRNFVDENNNWYSNAFERVDWFVEQAGKRGMYVIIDMHGAYGSQNGSDHSGIDGGNNKQGASEFFFGSNAASNQEKYYQMWEKIAEHFNGNPVVAGYDLLNEPYNEYRYSSGYSDDQLHLWLWNIYNNAYKRIRAKDSNHVIIMEATWEPYDLPNPSTYGWENIMYEYHNYLYDDYDNAGGQQIANMQKKINNINSANYNVPSYMGEFSYFNNTSAWAAGLQLLNDNGLNWTSWSYKCVSEYGNWGLVNQSVSSVNVESDSYDTILSKWSNVGSGYLNSGLVNVFKNYTPGVISSRETECMDEGSYYLECTDNIVTAADSGNSPLIANKTSYTGTADVLEVINNGNGTISLKSKANGKYVCAVIDENNQLLPRSSVISMWEQFEPVHITGNQYALRSIANGKYVKADFDDTANKGQLKAVSDNIGGAWECFNFNSVSEQMTTQAPTIQPTQEPTTQAPTTVEPTTQNTANIPTEVIGFVIQNIEGNKVSFAWGQSTEQIASGQKYNVYIDNNLYGTYDMAQALTCEIDKAGEHTIMVKAILAGKESAGVSEKVIIEQEETTSKRQEEVTTSKVGHITVSDKISIEGFQISHVLGGLRTVSSVEKTIDGKNVVEFGNIYAVERDGISADDMYIGSDNIYVKSVQATNAGIIEEQFSSSSTATNYVMTMIENGYTSAALTQDYMIRGYAKLSDGSYVYSKAARYSIYKVAKDLYENTMMNTGAGHNYLYNSILKVVDNNYKEVDYNWGTIIVK